MTDHKMTPILLAALMAILPFAVQGQAQPEAPVGVIELREQAGKARAAGNYAAFRNAMVRLHEMRPNNSEYMYQLVLAHALMDEKSAAYDLMLAMQRQGLSYDFDQTEDSVNLRNTEVYDYLNELLKTAGQPFGSVTRVATLGADVKFPEAIDWDPQREEFLVGTVADGLILAVGKDGATRELLRADEENGMWGVYAVLVDAPRNRLWVSSASNRRFSGFDPVDTGRSAIFEFSLDSLELIKRYPVPVDGMPHRLGKMAMAPDGELYAVDGRLPIMYAKRASEDRMRPVFTSNQLLSLRGLTLSDDGRMVYFADYEMGIVIIDTETDKYGMLRAPETLNLGGIEGLYYWDGHLVAIQSGISPQRVMRLRLDDAGTAVVHVAPLAVSLDEFDHPNFGTVVDDQLYFFSNSHWETSSDDLAPVNILRVDLAAGEDIIEPDLQEILERQNQGPPPGGDSAGAKEGIEGAGQR